jgi:hypothetical protein
MTTSRQHPPPTRKGHTRVFFGGAAIGPPYEGLESPGAGEGAEYCGELWDGADP